MVSVGTRLIKPAHPVEMGTISGLAIRTKPVPVVILRLRFRWT